MENESASEAKQQGQSASSRYTGLKRPDLVMKYAKSTEGSDAIYDSLQLLAVVMSMVTIYFAVARNNIRTEHLFGDHS